MKDSTKDFMKFSVLVMLMAVIGMLFVTMFTTVFDIYAFEDLRSRADDDGNVSQLDWERYLTQAVESYVYGSALAIILTIGIIAIVLGWWLREGRQ